MRILRIINRFNLGGPTYNVAYLSKYLSPDYDTLLIGGANTDEEASSDYILQKLGVHYLKIPEMSREIGYNDLTAYHKIKAIMQRYKPDIVHTHASKAGFLGRKAAFSLDVPIVVHTYHGHIFHSYFNKYKTAFFKKLERDLARRTSAIVAISETQKYELCKIHKIAEEEKFHVIPLGFDIDRFQEDHDRKRTEFRQQYHLDDNDIAISIIGRLVPIKNHALFIKAFNIVKQKTKHHIRALIVGDGNLRKELTELALSLGLSCSSPENPISNADIIFTSWIQESDTVLAGSDITALTSLNEGTPVSLIEAQAADTPIVTTNVGGIEDVVLKDKTALLAKNNDLQSFSQQLLRMVDDTKLRHDIENNHTGWNFVKDKFHYSRLVNDTKKLYSELLYCNSYNK